MARPSGCLPKKITGAAAEPCASGAPMTQGTQKRKRAMNFAAIWSDKRMNFIGRGSRKGQFVVLPTKGATQ